MGDWDTVIQANREHQRKMMESGNPCSECGACDDDYKKNFCNHDYCPTRSEKKQMDFIGIEDVTGANPISSNGSAAIKNEPPVGLADRPTFSAPSVFSQSTSERRYLPTFSDLVDRLCIVQQKAIFIPDKRNEYLREIELIMHDIDLILGDPLTNCIKAADVRVMLVLMLSNRFIWENETLARQGGPEQDSRLKLTHSINGVRNAAKNELARIDNGRKDYKLDCFAAELVEQFGDWNVFAGAK